MTARAENQPVTEARRDQPDGRIRRILAGFSRFIGLHVFSSLTRRIIVLNLVALTLLVAGILYLNQFRAGLTEARVQSLQTQGEIIAGAIATSATSDADSIDIDPQMLLDLEAGQSLSPVDQVFDAYEFAINPERVAPILRRLVSPTRTRARVYDRDGTLVADSRHLYARGQILGFDLPPPAAAERSLLEQFWHTINLWLQRTDLPVYKELGGANGKGYPEVIRALDASSQSVVRVTERGELIVSVAVPIQRYRTVYGALLLSTEGGDIDAIVYAERLAIVRVLVVVAAVTVLLSILMAGTIAAPLRRLADAADRVRGGIQTRPEIPDYSHRGDEIGHLSQAIREMTSSLYSRIEAIESFAADVAHELKNPLTSLRSAVETLPLAKTEDAKTRLATIIQHDVRRLDRLISDISNASRLDAELARQDAGPVDMRKVLETVVQMVGDTTPDDGPKIQLDIEEAEPDTYVVTGHDIRLGQVFNNLIDNARSFCRRDGIVNVTMAAKDRLLKIVVDDDGPGIRSDQFERIFERFYTDRPEGESFGQNSGLGLSISKQIVDAHRGRIQAENRTRPSPTPGEPPEVLGARFTVTLPRP
ncbi:MAG: sensor histidine kinase [Bauldia sp.]|uniref:sensor histidine kinase n=1 Tax=Bauldia sp. TaxID=2575872 RepID=UPI001D9BF2B8|nr:sensor histidine kinase [Bauldia sp.]MCB1497042.1 sensor histidine kinase [Bauldia sp.]